MPRSTQTTPMPMSMMVELRDMLKASDVSKATALVEHYLMNDDEKILRAVGDEKKQASKKLPGEQKGKATEKLINKEDESDAIEKTLSKTRKIILITGFVVCVFATVIVYACIRRRFDQVGKFCGTLFLMLSAVVLYLGAIVPQIQLFDKVKERATDGVMTSFLALAMVAVTIGLIGRGISLKTAYASKSEKSTDHIVAWIAMSVIVVPFLLHVYMIYQIGKYNDDKTATTAASKRLARWAWKALLVVYLILWITMGIYGYVKGNKIRKERIKLNGDNALGIEMKVRKPKHKSGKA